jgi:hypothetical protein
MADIEVYSRNFAWNQRFLATYQNKTTKLAWYEKFGKKFKLASGVLTTGGDKNKFLCKTSFALSGDELLALCDRLSKATRLPGTLNDFHLAEGTDWNGNVTRLVLRDSDYGGLVLVRLKSITADIQVIEADDSDPDPDPADAEEATSSAAATNVEWSECFDKFYFSKKDDWGNFKKILLSLHADTQFMLSVDDESTIPPQLPRAVTPSIVQKQIVGPTQPQSSTTKGGKRSVAGGKHKKPNSEIIPDEVFKKATTVLVCFMSRYRVSAKQCVVLYKEEMLKVCVYDYSALVHLFDKECEDLARKAGKKIYKYNKPTEGSVQLTWTEK